MSVGSDDSGSSDPTSYYCNNCDTRHELGSKDTPFIYNAGYSSDGESIDNIPKATTWEADRHQIYAILSPITGEEISEGERTPQNNRNRRRNTKASATNDDNAYTITDEEWTIARDAIANLTPIPIGASAGTLNAYHAILENNRDRLSKEQNKLNQCQ
jgi:hypothetical protein